MTYVRSIYSFSHETAGTEFYKNDCWTEVFDFLRGSAETHATFLKSEWRIN